MEEDACNYDATASFPDASCDCLFGLPFEATNFDSGASVDDGSCVLPNANCPEQSEFILCPR